MATVGKKEACQLPPGEEELGVYETPAAPVTIPSPAHVDEQEKAAGERRPAGEGPAHVCRMNSSHKLCFSSISCLCSDFVCPDPSWSPPAQGLTMTSAPRVAEGWRPFPSMSLCDPPLPAAEGWEPGRHSRLLPRARPVPSWGTEPRRALSLLPPA